MMNVKDLIEQLKHIGDDDLPVAVLSDEGDELHIRAISYDPSTGPDDPYVWIETISMNSDDPSETVATTEPGF